MKKLLSILFIASLLIFFSCSGGKSGSEEESSEESSKETKSKKKSSGTELISSCEDFLDRYEEWIALYIQALKEVLKAYKENPYDAETMNKYAETMSEASVWAQDWTKLHVCATREKYRKRFEEIGDKVSKALDELGAE